MYNMLKKTDFLVKTEMSQNVPPRLGIPHYCLQPLNKRDAVKKFQHTLSTTYSADIMDFNTSNHIYINTSSESTSCIKFIVDKTLDHRILGSILETNKKYNTT